MSGARRVAAIDCGTNSVRLLVVEVDDGSGLLVDVAREMRIVRLGEGVDATGRLSEAALERTFAAVEEYARIIESTGADALRFVATSATRDADNRDVFVSGIRGRLGVEPEVISGAEEAALSFAGATRDLDIVTAAPPCLVVDIGGGSTEFVMGEPGREPTASASVDVGCVRMTERHFVTDPPWPAEVAAARDDIDAAIREVATTVPLRQAATLVGLAGSVTTVAALAMGMWEYDSGQDPRRGDHRGRCAPRLRGAALLHAGEAGGQPGDPPRAGRRDRGRIAGAVGGRGLLRRSRGAGQRARHPRRHRRLPRPLTPSSGAL